MDTAALLSSAQLTATTFVNDFLVMILVVALFGAYVFWRGKGSLITFTLGVYAALVLYANLPFSIAFGSGNLDQFFVNTVVLFLLALVAHLILDQVMYTDDWSYGMMGFVSSALLVAASSVLVLAILFQVLHLPNVYEVSPILLTLFAPESYFFWWLLAPFVAIGISSRL